MNLPRNEQVECDDYLFVTNGAKYWMGPVRDILRIETDGNYMHVFTPTGKFVFRRTLASLESRLPVKLFFRTGRTQLVNLSQVKEISALDSKRFSFTLTDGSEVSLSRLQTIAFKKLKSL